VVTFVYVTVCDIGKKINSSCDKLTYENVRCLNATVILLIRAQHIFEIYNILSLTHPSLYYRFIISL
ncbi:hypothetical protein ACJX0J_013801, partial [Zea mays]